MADREVAGHRVILVPDLIGFGYQNAMAKLVGMVLNAVALTPGFIGITVDAQRPSAGSRVARGSTVILAIAGPRAHCVIAATAKKSAASELTADCAEAAKKLGAAA